MQRYSTASTRGLYGAYGDLGVGLRAFSFRSFGIRVRDLVKYLHVGLRDLQGSR